jgi:hypothetical protein
MNSWLWRRLPSANDFGSVRRRCNASNIEGFHNAL